MIFLPAGASKGVEAKEDRGVGEKRVDESSAESSKKAHCLTLGT